MQTHTGLIWSIQFDKNGFLVIVATIAVLVVLGVVLAKRCKKLAKGIAEGAW